MSDPKDLPGTDGHDDEARSSDTADEVESPEIDEDELDLVPGGIDADIAVGGGTPAELGVAFPTEVSPSEANLDRQLREGGAP